MRLRNLARHLARAVLMIGLGLIVWFTILIPALIGWGHLLGFFSSPKGT